MFACKQFLIKKKLFRVKAASIITMDLSCWDKSVVFRRNGHTRVVFKGFDITQCRIAAWVSDFLDSELLITFHVEIVIIDDQIILKAIYSVARAFSHVLHRLH